MGDHQGPTKHMCPNIRHSYVCAACPLQSPEHIVSQQVCTTATGDLHYCSMSKQCQKKVCRHAELTATADQDSG